MAENDKDSKKYMAGISNWGLVKAVAKIEDWGIWVEGEVIGYMDIVDNQMPDIIEINDTVYIKEGKCSRI